MNLMECRHDKEAIHDFLDGTLNAFDAIALTERIRECPVCSREYEALKRTQDLARKMPHPLSADSRERVLARFRHTVAPQPEKYAPTRPLRWQAGFAVGVMSLAAFAALLWLPSSQSPRQVVPDGVVIKASLPSNIELDFMTSQHAASSHALPGHDTAAHRDIMGDANARLRSAIALRR